MTKDKALFILGEMPEWNCDCRYSRDEYEEVIELCRALLLASDKEKETDLISREAVIDLLNQFGYYNKEMKRDLSAIPSAVPEREKESDPNHYAKVKEWAKNNGFVFVPKEWYDKARVAYYWRYYGKRGEPR